MKAWTLLASTLLLFCDAPERRSDETGGAVELPPGGHATHATTATQTVGTSGGDTGPATPDDPETPQGDDTEADDTAATESPYQACGGVMPVRCLAIESGTGDCSGSVCGRARCFARASADYQIELARCLQDECGIAPPWDLTCYESWAALAEECWADQCPDGLDCHALGQGFADCARR